MSNNKTIIQSHNDRLNNLLEQVESLPDAGGGSAVVESLEITENGTYTASGEVDGYSPITVNVPTPEPVLETLSVTANGTYNAPDDIDGYSSVKVNVTATAEIPVYTVTLSNAPSYISWCIYVRSDGSIYAVDPLMVSSIQCRQGLIYMFQPGYTITASGGVTQISTEAPTAGTPDSIFVFSVTGNGTLTFAIK